MPAKPSYPLSPEAEAAFKTLHYEIGKRDDAIQRAYVVLHEEKMRLLAMSADALTNLPTVGKHIVYGDRSYTEFSRAAGAVTDRLPDELPGQGKRPALATFGPPADRKRMWILKFEDADKEDMHFHNEDEAQRVYENCTTTWNCTLFVTAYER